MVTHVFTQNQNSNGKVQNSDSTDIFDIVGKEKLITNTNHEQITNSNRMVSECIEIKQDGNSVTQKNNEM